MTRMRQGILGVTLLLALLQTGCLTSTIRYAAHPPQMPREERGRPPEAVRPQQSPPDSTSTSFESPKPENDRLREIVADYQGTPYVYGGADRSGMDCSGFVMVVYREWQDMPLPHSSRRLYHQGNPVVRNQIQKGDLVFFRTGVLLGVDHVGIYLGEGEFAHASSKVGVTVARLDEDYFVKRFAGTRRIK